MLALRLPDLSKPPPPPAPPPPPPPPDPALVEAIRTEAEEAGRAIGHAEGLAEGRAMQAAAQEAAMQRALEAVARAMEAAAEAGRNVAEESAAALASLLARMLDHVLPGACERAGPDIVARLVVPLLPAIADRPEAVLHVAPALVDPIAARMPPGGPEVVADAAVAPGDARLAWRDGAQLVELAMRRAAVVDALRAAGVWDDEQGESA
ncbi:hypothetical protein [Falsiroseomonas sp.]|jgi:flagellar assembly protein FliH|uniref:hypothetical protein n=1 Tax=Falsiroseomonas sp. TaxID=2870721 RepID=UPI003F72F80C